MANGEDDTVEGYVVKYALSGRVSKMSGRLVREGKYFSPECDRSIWAFFGVGTEFFVDRARAVARVHEMRQKKLASLRKQIAKIEAIDPEKVVG